MTCFTNVQSKLDDCLQRDMEIVLSGKVIRRGVFILYTIKDYCLTLIIKTPSSNKTYDVLYPFGIDVGDDNITFDYDVNNLISARNKTSQSFINDKTLPINHKFFNKKLVLNFS